MASSGICVGAVLPGEMGSMEGSMVRRKPRRLTEWWTEVSSWCRENELDRRDDPACVDRCKKY